MHQVGDQPRLYYDVRSTNHQDLRICISCTAITISTTETLVIRGLRSVRMNEFNYLQSTVRTKVELGTSGDKAFTLPLLLPGKSKLPRIDENSSCYHC